MADGDDEFVNFNRLGKLIVYIGSEVLRDVLVHVIQPDTLKNAFQQNLATINSLYKRKVLFDEEFNLLRNTSPNPEDFDITLLVKIFRNICTIICPTVVSPNHDWNNPPGQNDISLVDDIHRMREFRNSMFVHSRNAKVTYNDFQAKWSEVREVIVRISGYGSPELKQQKIEERIDNLKTETIDQSTFQDLLQTLSEQEKNHHNETMEELKKQGAVQRDTRTTQLELLHTQADGNAKMHEMHKDIKYLTRDREENNADQVNDHEIPNSVDEGDADQVTGDHEIPMSVDEGDDVKLTLHLVRLIKSYPWLKSEMYLVDARMIAKTLLIKDSVNEVLLARRRRIAVDKLLKHVLRTKTQSRFFKLLEKHWKPSDEIQELMRQSTPTEEDIEAYRHVKILDAPQWHFQDNDRQELRYTIKDFITIDTLNNCFLAKFFYSHIEHDVVMDKLLQNLGAGVDCLFDTMYKCDRSIVRCFCDTLESSCLDNCEVVTRLDLRKKYCDPATAVEGDGTFLEFISGPLRRLFNFFELGGFSIHAAESGSLVVYLSANTLSAWEELKHRCKSGKIVELLDTLDINKQTLEKCFEEEGCLRITIYSVKDKKSAWPKAILRLDSLSQDQSVDEDSETNPIKRNMDILCEELEISDSLIEELEEQKLVPDDIRMLLEEQHRRAYKIQCLMENIIQPEQGFKALQDYVKRNNTYLFEQLERSTEEYQNTTVFFKCEAHLRPYVSGSFLTRVKRWVTGLLFIKHKLPDLTRFQWEARDSHFFDAEDKEWSDCRRGTQPSPRNDGLKGSREKKQPDGQPLNEELDGQPAETLHEEETPITQEHINYARTCIALGATCTEGLREILLRNVPRGYNSIYSAMLANKSKLTSMKNLRPDQINKIFPDPNDRYTGTVDQFDITLLYAIIKSISSVQKPVTRWGMEPNDHPRDTSIGANVERIRRYRNKSSHSVDGRLDKQSFEASWNEIGNVIDDIEKSIGGRGYREALGKMKSQPITPHEANEIRIRFQRYCARIKEGIPSVKAGLRNAIQTLENLENVEWA